MMIPKWMWVAGGVVIACAVMAAALIHGQRQHKAGYLKAQTEYRRAAAEAHARQAATVLERERRAAADLAAAQAEIEKERTHAETIITGLRGELGRVQQYAAGQGGRRNLPATAETAGAPDEAAAAGWQLFGRCAERYAGVAEIADRQRNDLAEWQAYGQVVVGAE